jgi:predicted PhzF superfamily epimerase YddE/YHI9
MKVPIYQIDAFTNEQFKGNPAAVCPLNEWKKDNLMQKIAIFDVCEKTQLTNGCKS